MNHDYNPHLQLVTLYLVNVKIVALRFRRDAGFVRNTIAQGPGHIQAASSILRKDAVVEVASSEVRFRNRGTETKGMTWIKNFDF